MYVGEGLYSCFLSRKKKKEGKLRESYSQIDLVFACL